MNSIDRQNAQPPRAGQWDIDLTHYPRAVTHYLSEIVPRDFGAGFSESCRMYGLLVEALDYAAINGFMYTTRRVVGAGQSDDDAIAAEVARRCATAEAAFDGKIWRTDLRHWDTVEKPAAIRGHQAIQRVDPLTLDGSALAAHVDAATKNEMHAAYLHGRYTMTAYLPVGDYLAHAKDWTGAASNELLRPVVGYSDVSQGVAASELATLSALVQSDAAMAEIVRSSEPTDVLAAIKAAPGRLGEAGRAWIDAVGYRIVTGYDLCDFYALEMPAILVGGLKAAVEVRERGGITQADESDVAPLRDRVPDRHRAAFDELLGEARLVYRLREERDHYSDGWATGLLRRALLAAGQQLTEAGRLHESEHLLDARPREVPALLQSHTGPTADELAERANTRKAANPADVPQRLGSPLPNRLKLDTLSAPVKRLSRAVEVFIAGMLDSGEAASEPEAICGIPVSPGTYEGRARVVLGADQFGLIEQGDILVTKSTSPYFNVLLPLLGAIVTDHGGALSHAAIVSREYGIPGVVGTKIATKTIRDGQRIRVEGSTGRIVVLA